MEKPLWRGCGERKTRLKIENPRIRHGACQATVTVALCQSHAARPRQLLRWRLKRPAQPTQSSATVHLPSLSPFLSSTPPPSSLSSLSPMTSTTNASWVPTGRHKVQVGTSLGKALKARKGAAPPPKRSNLPERQFYSFRCAFASSSHLICGCGLKESCGAVSELQARVDRFDEAGDDPSAEE